MEPLPFKKLISFDEPRPFKEPFIFEAPIPFEELAPLRSPSPSMSPSLSTTPESHSHIEVNIYDIVFGQSYFTDFMRIPIQHQEG